MWVPPRMPAPLLQELFWPDVWKVSVVCLFLNCTQRKQVETIIDAFFERYPSADAYIRTYESSKQDIVDLIRPLGFYNRRAERLYRFSVDFVSGGAGDPRGCFAIGKYATACYEMLFLGRFGEDPPEDHALQNYYHFVKSLGISDEQKR